MTLNDCRRDCSGPRPPTSRQVREYADLHVSQGAWLGSSTAYFLVAFLVALGGHPRAAIGFAVVALLSFGLLVAACIKEGEWLKGNPEVFRK